MLKLYHYPKCSSCKNAIKFLEKEHTLDITVINVFAPGKYFVHMLVYEELVGQKINYGTGKLIGSFKNIVDFKVVGGNFFSQIPIQLNAEWKLIK